MKKLNFGCGKDIREGWDNADIQKGKRVISFDFNKFPYPLKESSYDLIESRSVLQMLHDPDKVLNELWKVSKKGGTIIIDVPYWHNKGAYNDIQTKHLFNENCFTLFATQEPCRIEKKEKLKIKKIYLKPTIIGKIFPEFLRKKLDLFFSGIYAEIKVEFEVLK